ncbi:(R)-6-hydroxynicotine oxidase-like [Acropora palmata]|uniref:(R)-6-hydroxynicotine oxidase-like n=1 Tax=Acropora palmata TaxID=6131 RepID=UPI003D9FEA11
MSGREENTDDQVIKVLCEKSKLLAFVEGQNEYEKSMKRIFNAGGPLNKPKVCIKPKSADEVCNELEYASASHLHVSVLGGGHDPKGLAIIRDGIVLDMTAMKNVDIDVETETAWVEAGVTVKELDDFTCPHGLAAVNVTVTGKRIVALPQEHEELFWALRGAGQIGFGLVTKAQVQLHKIREKYVGGRFCYLPMAATKLGELLHDINVFCREAEDERTVNIYIVTQIPGVAVD